jgi:hypothetical protein
VTYLVAALFFALALLGSTVMLHMIVLRGWEDILLALRGELGLRPEGRRRTPRAPAGFHRRAAF